MSLAKINGCALVVERRIGGMALAIRARKWDEVEFCFDQVNRATAKLLRAIEEEGEDGR